MIVCILWEWKAGQTFRNLSLPIHIVSRSSCCIIYTYLVCVFVESLASSVSSSSSCGVTSSGSEFVKMSFADGLFSGSFCNISLICGQREEHSSENIRRNTTTPASACLTWISVKMCMKGLLCCVSAQCTWKHCVQSKLGKQQCHACRLTLPRPVLIWHVSLSSCGINIHPP